MPREALRDDRRSIARRANSAARSGSCTSSALPWPGAADGPTPHYSRDRVIAADGFLCDEVLSHWPASRTIPIRSRTTPELYEAPPTDIPPICRSC